MIQEVIWSGKPFRDDEPRGGPSRKEFEGGLNCTCMPHCSGLWCEWQHGRQLMHNVRSGRTCYFGALLSRQVLAKQSFCSDLQRQCIEVAVYIPSPAPRPGSGQHLPGGTTHSLHMHAFHYLLVLHPIRVQVQQARMH